MVVNADYFNCHKQIYKGSEDDFESNYLDEKDYEVEKEVVRNYKPSLIKKVQKSIKIEDYLRSKLPILDEITFGENKVYFDLGTDDLRYARILKSILESDEFKQLVKDETLITEEDHYDPQGDREEVHGYNIYDMEDYLIIGPDLTYSQTI